MRFLSVPVRPEDARIESMCLRYDHAHNCKQCVFNLDGPSSIREETDAEFERRRYANRALMRQLYEEATGQGFYKNPVNSHEKLVEVLKKILEWAERGPTIDKDGFSQCHEWMVPFIQAALKEVEG